jgi:regulator of sigma E protease
MLFVYFIVLVGVLVFVHELGHFLWAKYFGVHVIKFSLGFGPRIAGFRRKGTEYVISALPLGGYVRLLGDNPLDEIRPADEERSFSHQSLWRRVVIVIAGPAMNLLFPVALYFVVFLGDTELTPSTIGMVFPDRPADGVLLSGDRVVEIEGTPVETFYDMTRIIEGSAGEALQFKVLREGETVEQTLAPALAEKERPLERAEPVGRIGVMPNYPLPVVGLMSAASPAGAARLKTFDVIVAAAGKPLTRFIDLDRTFAKNQGSLIPITYLRPIPVQRALGGLATLDVYEPRVGTLTPEPGKGSGLARAGLELADLYVGQVTEGSPEHRSGLLPGDRLLALDGRPIRLWDQLMADLAAGRNRTHELTIRRAGVEQTLRYALQQERGVTEHGQVYERFVVGMSHWLPTRTDAAVRNPSPITYAIREAFRATREVVELTIFSVVRLLQGRLTVKSIGGPLTVFEVTGTAVSEGALNYLTLMAFISINLGLINLLPIPLLDGGHLVFFLIEAIMRRPVSLRTREAAHIAGFGLLMAMTLLAFSNDIERQWPTIVEQLTND